MTLAKFRVVVLVPDGLRTGGAEALFQLADKLTGKCSSSEVWLVNSEIMSHITTRYKSGESLLSRSFRVRLIENRHSEYRMYKCKFFDGFDSSQPTIFVLPECWLWMVKALRASNVRIVVWWLSVDNAFGALERLSNTNWLRSSSVFHAAQSIYAQNFLSALGINAHPLSDFSVVPEAPTLCIEMRPMKLSINLGKKVLFKKSEFEGALGKIAPYAEVAWIEGLSRSAIYEAFSTSRVFLDLGTFPGKDRMVREAILLGCQVCLSTSGAGKTDFGFPDTFLVPHYDLERALVVSLDLMKNPRKYEEEVKRLRGVFMVEEIKFEGEVKSFFHHVSS